MSDHNQQFMETFGTPDNEKPSELQKLEMQREQLIIDYNRQALETVLKNNAGRPVKVKQVNVFGAGSQFRDSFLKRQLDPLLEQNECLTLENYLANVDLTTFNFTKTGVTQDIVMNVDPNQYKTPFTSYNTLELITSINIKPVKKFFMKVGTNVGNGEGDGYVSLQWKNIFGGGEALTFDTNMTSNQIGTRNKSQYLFNYSMPIMNNPDYKFDSVYYHSSRLIDYTTFHEQAINGITNKISTNYLPFEKKFNHELSLETLVRSIKLMNSTSPLYRNNSLINDYFLFHAGDSFKSSLTYSLRYDTRDTQVLPTKGQMFKSSVELGFLPTSLSKFIKSTFDYSTGGKLLTDHTILNFSFRSGVIKSLGSPQTGSLHPMDKFQLGGPNDIRGFQMYGMGPKQMGLSIGGDAFWCAGLSIFSKFPFTKGDSGFKMHGFGNVGKLVDLSGTKSGYKNDGIYGLTGLTKEINSSIGVGVVYANPSVRFELNFAVPVSVHNGDELRKGIQYGIGLSFL